MQGVRPGRRRGLFVGLAAGGLLLAGWLVAGIERFDPDAAFGVVEGRNGAARRVPGPRVWVPPGWARLHTYPRHGVELPLPGAAEAGLQAPDGSRFGFNGWVTLRARPEAWAELHAASAGGGLEGVLAGALREAGRALSPQAGQRRPTPAQARDLEQALARALAARGVDLRGLDLDSLEFLTVEAGADPASPAPTRMLVVGLDGADWSIIDPLLAAGRMPHLAKLIERGSRSKLLSISPMLSPVIWTSAATGVEPTRHGIHDFLVESPGGGGRQPVTSAQRQVPTFWEMLSSAGVDVNVTAWWATWPADPVRGQLVSDRVAYQLFGFEADPDDAQGKTWPPDLYERVRPAIVAPAAVGWDEVRGYLDGERRSEEQFAGAERGLLDEFRTVLASGQTYLSIAERLRDLRPADLEVVYFEGTDTVAHLFMPYRPPLLPGVPADSAASFGAIVDRYYETADGYLGRLLEGRGEDWTVVVLSDHGFATDSTRPRSTDSRIGHGAAADWHRRFGILVLSGRHILPGTRLSESTIYDIAPTVLALFGQPVPASWPGQVLGRALDPAFLEAHPVRYRNDEMQRNPREIWAAVDPAAADLMEKLQSLGYVSGSAEGDSVTARSNVGVSLMAQGRYAEAEAEFRAAQDAGGAGPMLWVNLGLALRFQGRLDEAAALFERAVELPAGRRMAGNQLAQIRLEAGDLAGAEDRLRRLLAVEPDAAEVRNTLGLVLEQRGDLVAAEAEFRRAAELDPNLGIARNNLGNLAKRAGDLDEARRWYLRAIEADPYFIGAYNNLALVYQARGEQRKAVDLYNRALGKEPDNAVVLNNLASLYYHLGETERAAELWARAVEADPGYASPINNLASLKIVAGADAEAEALLARALELEPGYGDARINLAILYQGRGDGQAAREQLRLATEDPSAAAAAWSRLGLLELHAGRHEAAIEALTTAVERAPRSVEAWNGLGEAYLRQGLRAEAIRAWERSLAVDVDQPQLRHNLRRLKARSDGPPG